MNQPLPLVFENVQFGFGSSNLFSDMNLKLGKGSLHIFVGGNGGGKTTLLKLACGLLQPQSGNVLLFGKPVSSYNPQARAEKISYLAQFPVLPNNFSVLECVIQGRYPYSNTSFFDSTDDLEFATEALEQTGCLHLKDRNPSSLSGGEYQRVALARMLVQDTPILLLDEPGAHLDISHTIQIYKLMKDLAWAGKSICISTHDLNLAATYASHILMLKEGTTVCQGTVEETITQQHIQEVFGINCEIIPATENRSTPLVVPYY